MYYNALVHQLSVIDYKNDPYKAVKELQILRKVCKNSNKFLELIENKMIEIDIYTLPIDDL